MKSFVRLKGLCIKEAWQIIRDPSSILIAFILPVLLIFIFGYGVSLDANKAILGMVGDNRTDPDIRSFAQSIYISPYFNLKETGRYFKEIEPSLIAGKIQGVVLVPSYFPSYLKNIEQTAPIMVITDGTEPNTATFVANYVQGAWLHWQGLMAQEHAEENIFPIKTEPRYWYNEEIRSRHFLVPSSIAVILTIIGTLLTALVIAREWERGSMEGLLSTPVTKIELILGKLIPYFFLGMASMVVCTLLAVLVFDVPLRGSYTALCLTSSVYLFAALGMGLFISTITKNQFVASQAALISAFLPAFLLSGFIYDIRSMPLIIQGITYIIPARYLVSSLKTIFLVGDVWPLLIFNMACMALVACIFLVSVVAKTQMKLD